MYISSYIFDISKSIDYLIPYNIIQMTMAWLSLNNIKYIFLLFFFHLFQSLNNTQYVSTMIN